MTHRRRRRHAPTAVLLLAVRAGRHVAQRLGLLRQPRHLPLQQRPRPGRQQRRQPCVLPLQIPELLARLLLRRARCGVTAHPAPRHALSPAASPASRNACARPLRTHHARGGGGPRCPRGAGRLRVLALQRRRRRRPHVRPRRRRRLELQAEVAHAPPQLPQRPQHVAAQPPAITRQPRPYGGLIEAPWLVNGGHGASIRQRIGSPAGWRGTRGRGERAHRVLPLLTLPHQRRGELLSRG
jgi:hypothetical protein